MYAFDVYEPSHCRWVSIAIALWNVNILQRIGIGLDSGCTSSRRQFRSLPSLLRTPCCCWFALSLILTECCYEMTLMLILWNGFDMFFCEVRASYEWSCWLAVVNSHRIRAFAQFENGRKRAWAMRRMNSVATSASFVNCFPIFDTMNIRNIRYRCAF